MKKIIALLLVACMLLPLVACVEQPQDPTVPGTQPQVTQPQATDPKPTDPAPTDPKPTDPAPTDPAPTDPAPTDPAPTETEPKPDTKPETKPEPEAAKDAIKIAGNKPSYAEGSWATKDGYVGIQKDGYATYTFDAEYAGTYVLNMRYLSTKKAADLNIFVNGEFVFGDECAKNKKLTAAELCVVTLKAGENTLTVSNQGAEHLYISEFFLNPDELDMTKPTDPKPTDPPATEPSDEAEVILIIAMDITEGTGIRVTKDNCLGIKELGGGQAIVTFNCDHPGTYALNMRYVSEYREAKLDVVLNGKKVFDGTCDKVTAKTNVDLCTVTLKAGENTLIITNHGEKELFVWNFTLNPKETSAPDTQPDATEPEPTDPPATEPKPTVPAGDLPQNTIEFEAEKPVDKTIDTQKRTDMNGYSMDHSYRANSLHTDGLHYVDPNGLSKIYFCAFDSYTYEFTSEEAGEYYLYIVAACDRDTPVKFSINGGSGTGYFARNNFQSYDQIDLGKVTVIKGKNRITLTITENKNHNMRVDKYVLIPAHIVDAEKNNHDWTDVLNGAEEAEKPKTETTNKVWMELYVATNGKDSNDGSKNAPFATIGGAAKVIATLRSKMQGDIVVHVASGVYTITEPIVFTASNSGANGYRVIFRGDEDDKPVISGGVKVTGWTQVDGMDGVWSAPLDVADTRTFYVNDNMAVRARSEFLYAGTKTYKATGSTTKSDGMIFSSRGFPKMSNLSDVELVFDSEWMHHRFPVSDILYNYNNVKYQIAIVMEQPVWNWVHDVLKPNDNDPGDTQGFYVENAIELLDEPGEFYYNKEEKRIYYMPFDKEDLNSAECYVGVSEGLIRVEGTKTAPVTGLTFENLQFKYGAWNEVTETGMLTNQADNMEDPSVSRRNSKSKQFLGQFYAVWADDLTIRGCVFACLGSTAVAMPEGVTDSLIDGNVFKDISGVGISIGTDKNYSASTMPARIDITNNVIRRIGAEFRSSPAIIMYYVTGIRVMHNDIACTPYTGISLGWGWGKDVKDAKDNVIAYNKIIDVAWPTHDGAHIYVLSPNYNTYINNNYMSGSGDIRGGVYPDEGAAHLNIFHNVIEDVEQYWIYARPGVYLRDINAFQNYVDTDKVYIDERNVILHENTIVTNGKWPAAAQAIINEAGVSANYKHLLDGVALPSWHTNFVKNIPMDY